MSVISCLHARYQSVISCPRGCVHLLSVVCVHVCVCYHLSPWIRVSVISCPHACVCLLSVVRVDVCVCYQLSACMYVSVIGCLRGCVCVLSAVSARVFEFFMHPPRCYNKNVVAFFKYCVL